MSTTEAPVFEMRHRLGLAMEHAELDADDMATRLGCAATTVRNYLSGRTTPRRAVVMAWAALCDVPFEWLKQGISSTGWTALLAA